MDGMRSRSSITQALKSEPQLPESSSFEERHAARGLTPLGIAALSVALSYRFYLERYG